jgi:hypothetical protein
VTITTWQERQAVFDQYGLKLQGFSDGLKFMARVYSRDYKWFCKYEDCIPFSVLESVSLDELDLLAQGYLLECIFS